MNNLLCTHYLHWKDCFEAAGKQAADMGLAGYLLKQLQSIYKKMHEDPSSLKLLRRHLPHFCQFIPFQ